MTRHVPHLHLPGPWEGTSLRPSSPQLAHLGKVLRLVDGAGVTYTDGMGVMGAGTLEGDWVLRGEETSLPRPSKLVVAVSPPSSRDRLRFCVEKLAEIGVMRLTWLRTRWGEGRIAAPERLWSWVSSALEQSRGAWAMTVDTTFSSWEELERPLLVCHPGPDRRWAGPVVTLAIGPEAGFHHDEIPADARLLDLGPTTLRTETAAIVAAASLMIASGFA